MLRRELTEILQPVQQDLARVSGLLQGASLADSVADTRSLAKELCARIEGLEANVAASVAESGELREESSRLLDGGTNQLAVASANLEGLAKDLAERLSELGSAIEAQALVVAPRIVEEVATAFQLPADDHRGRLRRKADVGAGLAVSALRGDLEALRKDLATVGPDLDRLTPTLDSLAERQTELEAKIDSLAQALSRLAAKQEKKATTTTVTLTAKERSALASAIAAAMASRTGLKRGGAAGAQGPRALDEEPPDEGSDHGSHGGRSPASVRSVTKPGPQRRKPRAVDTVTSGEPAVLWSMQRSAPTDESV